MCVITPIRRNYDFENQALARRHTRSRASPARRSTRPRANPARCRTRPRNIPLVMTIKNDGHGSMSMELRGLRYNGFRRLMPLNISTVCFGYWKYRWHHRRKIPAVNLFRFRNKFGSLFLYKRLLPHYTPFGFEMQIKASFSHKTWLTCASFKYNLLQKSN